MENETPINKSRKDRQRRNVDESHQWCHSGNCSAVHQSINQSNRSPGRPLFTDHTNGRQDWLGEHAGQSVDQQAGRVNQPAEKVNLAGERTRMYNWKSTDYSVGSRLNPDEFCLSVDGSRLDPDEFTISVEGSQLSINTGLGVYSPNVDFHEFKSQTLHRRPKVYEKSHSQDFILSHDYQNVPKELSAKDYQNIPREYQGPHHYHSQHLGPHLGPYPGAPHRAHGAAHSGAQCRLHASHASPSRTRRNRGGSVSSSSDHSYPELDRQSIISGLDRISVLSATSTLDRSSACSTLDRDVRNRTLASSRERSNNSARKRSTSTLDRTGSERSTRSLDRLLSASSGARGSNQPSNQASCQGTPKTRHRRKSKPQIVQSEPPSPGHSCHSDASSGGGLEERTSGCCALGQQEPNYSNLGNNKPPPVSNCVKSFMSWMVSKAEKGTSAILDNLPHLSKEDFHVVMIGLDGAGKTTALYRLKFDQYINTVPTIGFNCERIRGSVGKSRGLTFLIWDVGGQEKIRPLWRSYTRCTDGIMFVVDSADHDTFEEAKVELYRTMRYQDNSAVPLLILANKQDLPGAVPTSQIEEALGLRDLNTTLWQVEPTCSVTGEGLDSGLEALHQLILKKKKNAKRNRNKTK